MNNQLLDLFIPNEVYRHFDDKHLIIMWRGARSTGTSQGLTRLALIKNIIIKGESVAVFRQYNETHRKSTWLLFRLLLDQEFKLPYKVQKTDMTITFDNGASIYFLGLSDPEKVKSIVSEKPISFVWFEEATEIRTEDALDIAMMSFREAEHVEFHFSYNPTNPLHFLRDLETRWAEVYGDQFKLAVTNIYDNKFNTKEFIERQLKLKTTDRKKYNVNVLGMWQNLGDIVFRVKPENLIHVEQYVYSSISIGVDIGDDDATTFVAVGWTQFNREAHVLDVYYHSNVKSHTKKGWEQFADDLRDFVDKMFEKYSSVSNLDIAVETASGGNTFIHTLAHRGVMARKVKKRKVQEKVKMIETMLNTNMLKINDAYCKELLWELNNATRDLNATDNSYWIKDGDDHTIDGLAYAVYDYYSDTYV